MHAARCTYPSKPCFSPRSYKDDGTLHRLCMFHRQRANDAQRRWHERQRRDAKESRAESSSADEGELTQLTKKRRRVDTTQITRAMTSEAYDSNAAAGLAIDRSVPPLLLDDAWWSMSSIVPLAGSTGGSDAYTALLEDECFQLTEFFAEMDNALKDAWDPLMAAGLARNSFDESIALRL